MTLPKLFYFFMKLSNFFSMRLNNFFWYLFSLLLLLMSHLFELFHHLLHLFTTFSHLLNYLWLYSFPSSFWVFLFLMVSFLGFSLLFFRAWVWRLTSRIWIYLFIFLILMTLSRFLWDRFDNNLRDTFLLGSWNRLWWHMSWVMMRIDNLRNVISNIGFSLLDSFSNFLNLIYSIFS